MIGHYQERTDMDNKLVFEIESDQSYFESTLTQMEQFVDCVFNEIKE